jgi:class 3 adenylate cyclase
MSTLPTGTVTFLFTDIEGSTRLAQNYPDTWESLRQRHHAILQSALQSHGGYVFQIIGDAFCVAFHNAGDALRAAVASQNGLLAEKWGEESLRVRMGIHTGKAEIQADGQYQGYLAMSRVQRVMSVAYGNQVLISSTTGELVRGELPKGVSLLDLKEHRLKGLINPEHIRQVVAPEMPKDFPPLQSRNDIPNNLPIHLTSFIGREKEIEELIGELSEHRIVTLTGSGGTGKTRLALQVAAEVIDAFPGGVWFVELAPVTDPGLVPNTLANLLGLRELGESKQTINELICAYLHPRRVLLLFDN